MPNLKEDLVVDITGFKCPVPLIKARRAVKQTSKDQLVKFIGTKEEEISRKEILVALESMKQPVINMQIDASTGNWEILMKKKNA
ncbi:MAG: sulfurtransferase TusA family protein [Candidatus Hodarchaeales archaeon]|jgi:TusA-related sulfurtransferase